MINGAREFALRWLLEPTKKLEEVQYEYVFRLITRPIDKQTFVVYKANRDDGALETHTIENPSTLPIIQADLYTKTSQGRNFIGSIEYFKLVENNLQEVNLNTYETNIKYFYTLAPSATFLYLSSSEKDVEYYYTPDPYGVGVPEEKTLVYTFPSNIYSADYFSFAENSYFELQSNGSISIRYVSYPDYEAIQTTTITGLFPAYYEDTIKYSGKTNSSFSFDACKSSLKNLDDYQESINTPLESEIPSISYQNTTFAKCSNGLTFDRFMAIAQETQYFNKNTTITFEHD